MANFTSNTASLEAVLDKVNAANNEVAAQTELISQIMTALEGKSVPGGSGAAVETCSITINGVSGVIAYTTFEEGSSHAEFISFESGNTIDNVVCGTAVSLYEIGPLLTSSATDGTIIEASYNYVIYEAPLEACTAVLTLTPD